MENLNNYSLSSWGNLWKYIGISTHSKYGIIYGLIVEKTLDIKDWILYKIGLSDKKIPLFGESLEDYYIRRLYTTSYDCFHRPIFGPASTHIKVCLRGEKPIENSKVLVIKEGKYKDAINFGSYNYLGFGGYNEEVTPTIIKVLKNKGSCITGFARETGISQEQEKLEKMLAKFLHKEDCITVPMGFATNSTLIPILASKGDIIFSDALNHSSLIVGMKSSGAEVKIFKHNNINDLKNLLDELMLHGMKNGEKPKKVFVCVEGLYSMEGEFCKLKEIIALKKSYGFYLYVDEAHSIGCLGNTGRGIVEQLGCSFDDIDILMGTFSKSFASAGGYICSDSKTINLLRSNSYAFVYGSAMSPVTAQQIISCLEIIDSPKGRAKIAKLRKNSINLRTKFIDAGCHVLGDLESPVIPVLIYHPVKIKDISRICLKNGVAIVVVAFPACPLEACRIRFCVSSGHTEEDIETGFKVTLDALQQTGCIFGLTPQPLNIYHPPDVDLIQLQNLPKNTIKMLPLYECSVGNKKIKEKPLPERPTFNQLNISSYDIYDFESDKKRLEKIIDTINIHGCGSCGPRNFYGGTLEHFALEEELKKFYSINEAIVISYGHNVMSSVIPVYGKPGNVILFDEFCNYPIQLGSRLSKAKKFKFKHNDLKDLSNKLEEAKTQIKSKYSLISIVIEGIFQHDHSLAPIKEIVKIKNDFKTKTGINVYIILDDSLAIGTLGCSLKGSLEYAELTLEDIDILCGSFEFCLNSIGGFIVGNYTKISKCRLFAAGYIFSASAPPYSCLSAKDSIQKISQNGKEMKEKLKEIHDNFNMGIKNCLDKIKIIGNEELPCLLIEVINGKDKQLIEKLKENGFFIVQQQHLEEDLCQNEYIKMNLGVWFTKEKMEKFFDVINNF